LEALGVDIELEPEAAAAAIESVGIAFLFAPLYHPAVRHVAAARRELGFRTLFNLTGPLCNPAGATRQVLGLFSPAWIELVAQALSKLGCERALVVHGEDGSDEITPVSATSVAELRDGRVTRTTVRPEDFGIERCSSSELVGGEAADNAATVRAVLAGEPGPKADAVALNAGAALYVAGCASDLGQGVARARAVLAEGAGLRVLDALIAFTAESRS
jgi:anthranilate phosphoribosyltransferase